MYRKIATSISYRHSPSSIPLSYKTIGQQLFDTANKFPDNLAVKIIKTIARFIIVK